MSKIAFVFPGQGHNMLEWEKNFMRTVNWQEKNLTVCFQS